jgi:hypothetical protein
VNAGLVVNVANRTDELCEDLLNFVDWERAVFEKMVVEFIAWDCQLSNSKKEARV